MPREGKTSITVDRATRDHLNQARQDRGQTWDAFLEDCLNALDTETVDGAGSRVDEIADPVLDEIAARTAREVREELHQGGF